MESKTVSIQSFLAAGLGGAIGKTAIAPLDRWKLLKQVYGHSFSLSNYIKIPIRTFSNATSQVLKETMGATVTQKNGPATLISFWKGNSLNIARAALFTSIQFNTFSELKRYRYEEYRISIPVASFWAGVIAQTVTFPLDQWRLRWSTDLSKHQMNSVERTKAMFAQLKSLVTQQKLFQGYTSTLVSSAPFNTLNFTLQDLIQRNASKIYPNFIRRKSEYVASLSGSIAACCCVTLLFPLDTIRRNIQASNASVQDRRYFNVVKSMYQTAITESVLKPSRVGAIAIGVSRFYCGYTANMVKTAINYGARWFVVEKFRK